MPVSTPSRSTTAVSRPRGLAIFAQGDFLCIDTFKDCADSMRKWSQLCPFTVWPQAIIPVPGRADLRARSIESIWQGLKIVDNELDLAQLHGIPEKRPPDHERGPEFPYADSRFRFGDVDLDIVTARYLIYFPTYLYVLDNLVGLEVHREIEKWISSGGTAAFYDWDANIDIDDPRSSFAHSALLAGWYGGTLDPLIGRYDELAACYGAGPLTARRYVSRGHDVKERP